MKCWLHRWTGLPTGCVPSWALAPSRRIPLLASKPQGTNHSSMEIHRTRSSSTSEPDVVADCDLVRQFIEHLFNKNHETDSTTSGPSEGDWKAIQDAVAGSDSVERAIGRSVITADLIARGKYRGQKESGGSGSGLNLRARLSGHKGATSAFLATSIVAITLVAACASIFGGSTPRATKPPQHLPSQSIEGNSQLRRAAQLTDATPGTTTRSSMPVAAPPPAPAPPSL